MECELCGRESHCRPALVDGIKMMLCPNCLHKHGKATKQVSQGSVSNPAVLSRIKKPREKDVYKNMDKELISNYAEIIKKARQKKSISREKLGFLIGERTVTISKFENGDLKPSDKVAKKLEKELDINLFEEVKNAPSYALGNQGGKGLTLGDFIKKE